MSQMQILDGTGDGTRAKVDKDNKLHVQSLSINYDDFAVLTGDSFGISSGIVNLTGSTRTDLLYFKNDDDFDIVLNQFDIGVGASTGGVNKDWEFTVISNPLDAGTLSNPLFVVNNNVGSAELLDLTGATGSDGNLVTGGIPFSILVQGESSVVRDQNVVIPPGGSFAVGFKPPTGNTSANVIIGINVIKQKVDFN
jgi:hypothetical protein